MHGVEHIKLVLACFEVSVAVVIYLEGPAETTEKFGY
jgi:hypothetical protein